LAIFDRQLYLATRGFFRNLDARSGVCVNKRVSGAIVYPPRADQPGVQVESLLLAELTYAMV
jgi:hypothetical protein